MSKEWYPIIDKSRCVYCGLCQEKCICDVFDREKSPLPIIKNINNCKDDCIGCATLCPTDAISYLNQNRIEKFNCNILGINLSS